jgi:DNA invertase Pin-like site-specific DNA recombinase
LSPQRANFDRSVCRFLTFAERFPARNYEDVTETIRTLMQRGVVITTIINGMTFDGATKNPVQMAVRGALIGFMAATAQAQAEATKEAQKAAIKAAREADRRRDEGAAKYRGRKPTFDVEQLHRTSELLAMGWSPSAIASEVGIPRATVYRIKEDPAKMAALLHAWAIL